MHEAKLLFPDEPIPELEDDPEAEAHDADEDEAALAMLKKHLMNLPPIVLSQLLSINQHKQSRLIPLERRQLG